MKKDLKQISIEIPSPLKPITKPSFPSSTPSNKSSKINKNSFNPNHNPNVLHQDNYYYLNKTGSVINLITDDFKLICLPDNLLPLHVKPGTRLALTIEQIEPVERRQEGKEIMRMQEEFRGEKYDK